VSLLDAPWFFIVNPAADRGRAGRKWKKVLPRLKAVLPNMNWLLTNGPQDAINQSQKLVSEGQRHLVAVGGDGTHHEVINGIYRAMGAEKSREVTYALLPFGSGNDWIKTHKLPRKVGSWLKLVAAGNLRQQNLGLIKYQVDNQPQERVFVNVAGLAYDAFVTRRAGQAQLRGPLLYPLFTLYCLKDFSPVLTRLVYDTATPIENRFYTVNVGIGRYSGGGMQLVPHAAPDAADFALTYAKNLPISSIVLNSWRFYTGGIGQVKQVTTTTTKQVYAESLDAGQRVEIEADGEWLGYGPVNISILPMALNFLGIEK